MSHRRGSAGDAKQKEVQVAQSQVKRDNSRRHSACAGTTRAKPDDMHDVRPALVKQNSDGSLFMQSIARRRVLFNEARLVIHNAELTTEALQAPPPTLRQRAARAANAVRQAIHRLALEGEVVSVMKCFVGAAAARRAERGSTFSELSLGFDFSTAATTKERKVTTDFESMMEEAEYLSETMGKLLKTEKSDHMMSGINAEVQRILALVDGLRALHSGHAEDLDTLDAHYRADAENLQAVLSKFGFALGDLAETVLEPPETNGQVLVREELELAKQAEERRRANKAKVLATMKEITESMEKVSEDISTTTDEIPERIALGQRAVWAPWKAPKVASTSQSLIFTSESDMLPTNTSYDKAVVRSEGPSAADDNTALGADRFFSAADDKPAVVKAILRTVMTSAASRPALQSAEHKLARKKQKLAMKTVVLDRRCAELQNYIDALELARSENVQFTYEDAADKGYSNLVYAETYKQVSPERRKSMQRLAEGTYLNDTDEEWCSVVAADGLSEPMTSSLTEADGLGGDLSPSAAAGSGSPRGPGSSDVQEIGSVKDDGMHAVFSQSVSGAIATCLNLSSTIADRPHVQQPDEAVLGDAVGAQAVAQLLPSAAVKAMNVATDALEAAELSGDPAPIGAVPCSAVEAMKVATDALEAAELSGDPEPIAAAQASLAAALLQEAKLSGDPVAMAEAEVALAVAALAGAKLRGDPAAIAAAEATKLATETLAAARFGGDPQPIAAAEAAMASARLQEAKLCGDPAAIAGAEIVFYRGAAASLAAAKLSGDPEAIAAAEAAVSAAALACSKLAGDSRGTDQLIDLSDDATGATGGVSASSATSNVNSTGKTTRRSVVPTTADVVAGKGVGFASGAAQNVVDLTEDETFVPAPPSGVPSPRKPPGVHAMSLSFPGGDANPTAPIIDLTEDEAMDQGRAAKPAAKSGNSRQVPDTDQGGGATSSTRRPSFRDRDNSIEPIRARAAEEGGASGSAQDLDAEFPRPPRVFVPPSPQNASQPALPHSVSAPVGPSKAISRPPPLGAECRDRPHARSGHRPGASPAPDDERPGSSRPKSRSPCPPSPSGNRPTPFAKVVGRGEWSAVHDCSTLGDEADEIGPLGPPRGHGDVGIERPSSGQPKAGFRRPNSGRPQIDLDGCDQVHSSGAATCPNQRREVAGGTCLLPPIGGGAAAPRPTSKQGKGSVAMQPMSARGASSGKSWEAMGSGHASRF